MTVYNSTSPDQPIDLDKVTWLQDKAKSLHLYVIQTTCRVNYYLNSTNISLLSPLAYFQQRLARFIFTIQITATNGTHELLQCC